MIDLTDPTVVATALFACRSITPDYNPHGDDGAIALVQSWAEALGFAFVRLDRNATRNIYAWRGSKQRLCFVGHTDVVPPGEGWTTDAFAPELRDGVLYGRGAVDMKGGIACFIAAIARSEKEVPLSLLITGDEEGSAVDGTAYMLHQLEARGETLDACILAEPTSNSLVGDTIKTGRRGSVNGKLTAAGTQGHAAYPQLTDNPVPKLAAMIAALSNLMLDEGTDRFPPSSLAFTNLAAGIGATNVTPTDAVATFNIRFNTLHTPASLEALLRQTLDGLGPYTLELAATALPFEGEPGRLLDLVRLAILAETGLDPALSTAGGTSDARFIRRLCSQIVELGLTNATMHKVDECVPVEHLETLTRIYQRIIEGWAA